jgi:hypothetical protein
MDLSGLRDAIACNGFVKKWIPIKHHDLAEDIR